MQIRIFSKVRAFTILSAAIISVVMMIMGSKTYSFFESQKKSRSLIANTLALQSSLSRVAAVPASWRVPGQIGADIRERLQAWSVAHKAFMSEIDAVKQAPLDSLARMATEELNGYLVNIERAEAGPDVVGALIQAFTLEDQLLAYIRQVQEIKEEESVAFLTRLLLIALPVALIAIGMAWWIAGPMMNQIQEDAQQLAQEKEEILTLNDQLKDAQAELEANMEELSVTNESLEAQSNQLKLINEQIIKTTEELSVAKDRMEMLSMVADKTDNAVVITDQHGLIEWVNEGFIQLTGFTLEEVKGSKPGAFLQGPETDPQTIRRIGEKVRNAQPITADIINYSKDGRKYWLRLNIEPVKDARGQLHRFIAVETDITQMKENELMLQDTLKRLRHNLTHAKKMQDALNQEEHKALAGFKDGFIYQQPRDIVSGDFYWRSRNSKEKIIVVADCTGHGASAALMTIAGISLLRHIVDDEQLTDPAEIIRQLDLRLQMLFSSGRDLVINDSICLTVMAVCEAEKRLRIATAQSSALLIRNGEAIQVKGSKFPAGGFQFSENKEFANYQTDLQEGDRYYLYSDGFQDQFGGPENKKYMSRRFREFLHGISQMPMVHQSILIKQEFLAWRQKNVQTDDILVVGIEP